MAALVGSEVVYLGGRGIPASTMTPYDVCALRLGDGTVLAGAAPEDASRYLALLRGGEVRAVAAALKADISAAGLRELVEQISGLSWDEAMGQAFAAGALVGAHAFETA